MSDDDREWALARGEAMAKNAKVEGLLYGIAIGLILASVIIGVIAGRV